MCNCSVLKGWLFLCSIILNQPRWTFSTSVTFKCLHKLENAGDCLNVYLVNSLFHSCAIWMCPHYEEAGVSLKKVSYEILSRVFSCSCWHRVGHSESMLHIRCIDAHNVTVVVSMYVSLWNVPGHCRYCWHKQPSTCGIVTWKKTNQ